MQTITTPRHQVPLAPRGLFELPDASGLEIGCTQGSLWVTLDNDRRDIILEPGQSFFTTEHRRALVYAFGASTLEVRQPAAAPQASSLRRLAKNSSDCSRSPSVWAATRAAISG